MILSGRDTQEITLPQNSKLNIVEVRNFSKGGVTFVNHVAITDLKDNGCEVKIASEENQIGWTLKADETYDGNLYLVAGTLDLNGHKLTVTGDILQSGGTVLVNGGELDVHGNYKLQVSNNVNNGILNMTNSADIVRITGDFVMQSIQSHSGKLSAGIMEVGGDIIQGKYSENFHTTGEHTIILNGTSMQTLKFNGAGADSSRINNLRIENTSDEGIVFGTAVYVVGDLYNTDAVILNSANINITSETNFISNLWDHDITISKNTTIHDVVISGNLYIGSGCSVKLGSDIGIKQSLYINGSTNLNGYKLSVNGDVWLNSQLEINRGKLNVSGDFNVARNNNSDRSKGYITMKYSEDYILVNGDMLFFSDNNYSKFTDGTLEIKGDFTQKYDSKANNFCASGNHSVILNGNALQKISFKSKESKFNFLEIKNTSDEGVVFVTEFTANNIITNGCNIQYYDPNKDDRILKSDKNIDGDLLINDDILDLNGHTLTVTGNLIHSGGTININGGELIVLGDYLIQTVDGEKFSSSTGKLLMTNGSDAVTVAGNFVMQSSVSHANCLTNGVLKVGGDFSQLRGSSNNFSTSNNHTIILNGTSHQTINFYYGTSSAITNLKISNSSEEGVTFKSTIRVKGKIYNTESVVNNSENIYADSCTVFENNEWNHNISFSGRITLSDNLKIKGDVYIRNEVNLPSNSKYAISEEGFSKDNPQNYTFSVEGSIYMLRGTLRINGGSLFIGNSVYFGALNSGKSGGIIMNNDKDYVLVNGNIYHHSSTNDNYSLSAGLLELKGNFEQYGDFSNYNEPSADFIFLLSGTSLQTVSVESDNFAFGIIDVNNSNDGVYFASMINAIELRRNGCKIKFAYDDSPGWTLSDDEVIEGDLTITRGTLDLNGHNLRVTGSLIQPGGIVLINGGELFVEGDYRIQGKSGEDYTKSVGELKMQNESDFVNVSGSFVMQSSKSHYNNLIAGILEIGRDLLVPLDGDSNNFYCKESHTTVLSGSTVQNVYIGCSDSYNDGNYYGYNYSRINNLKISNTSKEGVSFNSVTFVVGMLYNSTANLFNSHNICAVSSTVFENNTWCADIRACSH